VLAWQLGGRRPAQALAMTCVLAAPVFLGTGNYLSMNSFEPCFWMGCMLILVRIADGSSSPRAWLLFGVLAGLGIENKHSTVFFLIAVVLGLLLSALRQILFSRYCAGAAVILIVIALPNLLWQIANHFPTYEFLRNVAQSDKNLHHPPLDFLYEQIKVLLFSTAPLWIGGIVWFAFSRNSRPWRFVALIYLCFLAMMMAMHAKHYYLAPIYPVLFAAGAVGLSQLARRDWPVFTYAAVIGIGLLIGTGPVVLTILPPGRYAAYTRYFFTDSVRMEKYTSPLPQILSDRFGWPQMVEGFANRYNALPASERAQTAIFCGNYGEAGAVTILGSKYGLPAAISGHQNFFFWGWGGFAGESVLTLGNNAKDYTDLYGEVIDLGPFDAPWIMDHEHHHYFWLRHRKVPYAKAWPGLKSWN
jgi:4-amino-4-deoxy-L-arabinose transferase-like glycosyltransferase